MAFVTKIGNADTKIGINGRKVIKNIPGIDGSPEYFGYPKTPTRTKNKRKYVTDFPDLQVKHIATSDADFERVDFLKVWKP